MKQISKLAFVLAALSLLLSPLLVLAKSVHQQEDQSFQNQPQKFYQSSGHNYQNAGGSSVGAGKELEKKVFGFHPYWMGDAWKNYDFDLLSTIAYFGADLNGNGSIGEKHDWPVTDLITTAHQNDVKVVLVAKNFSTSGIRDLLSSASNRSNAINNLVTEVKNASADGVNIDFEYVPEDQRNNFTTFVRDLTNTFHQEIPGSEVSLDAPAVDWNSSWDISALAAATDVLMIMGYDYHYAGGSQAGPVAPLESGNQWSNYNVTNTINSYVATAGGNKHKLLLGVPYYGYDWPTSSQSIPSGTTGRASAVRFNTLQENIDTGSRHRLWNNDSHTPYYLYSSHQV
ncbi:hypothetical protein KKC60_04780, partial [Patescibacteria group bacterium]|nr:hypothetical protein [Patescibacteria group bacterium]